MKYQHSNVLKMSQHNIKESSSTNQCTLFRVSTIPLITSSMKVCSNLLCSNCRLISTGLSSNMRESSFSRDMLLAANGPARQYLHTVNIILARASLKRCTWNTCIINGNCYLPSMLQLSPSLLTWTTSSLTASKNSV